MMTDDFTRLMQSAAAHQLRGERTEALSLAKQAVKLDQERAFKELLYMGITDKEMKIISAIGESKDAAEKERLNAELEELVKTDRESTDKMWKLSTLWAFKDGEGKIWGPLTTSEVHRAVVMKYLDESTMIVRQGDSDYMPLNSYPELLVDESLTQEVLYQELIDTSSAKLGHPQCTSDDYLEMSANAIKAIEMDETKSQGFLLLADVHAWCGNLAKSYLCYLHAFNRCTPGSFVFAKAALSIYELLTDPLIEGRPEDVPQPEWVTDPALLYIVAVQVVAVLGATRQPGALRMKADALKLMGRENDAASAYTAARHVLAARLQELHGHTIGGPDNTYYDLNGKICDPPEDEKWGSAAAMLEMTLGDYTGLVADTSDPDLKTPMVPLTSFAPPKRPPLGIGGCNGRWPGGLLNPSMRDDFQAAAGDAMAKVPAQRWVLHDEDFQMTDTQKACVRHGGWLYGAELFDNTSFNISPAEAGAMDPQQRLLLEHGFTALHSSSWRRITLTGGDTGVFLGIERPDWAMAQPPSARASVYAVTGDNVSAAAGRLAFSLGLQGPCSTIDCACASALCALHAASGAVHAGECGGPIKSGKENENSAALALAVSLKLVPHGTLGAASAGMLSTDGRCKTLDNRANGYARSESIGVVMLRFHDDPQGNVAPPFDPMVAGSQVRQDGRSASLTAPNGTAQRVLHRKCQQQAAIPVTEIHWLEMHGTGTALGDPTETGAVAQAYSKRQQEPGDDDRRAPLVVMAAKAAVGHGEAPSGFVGVLKLYHLMVGTAKTILPSNVQLREINPMVSEAFLRERNSYESGGPLVTYSMHTQRLLHPVLTPTRTTHAGVSSFGFSGTISHCLMRHAVFDEPYRGEGLALRRLEQRFLKQWGMIPA